MSYKLYQISTGELVAGGSFWTNSAIREAEHSGYRGIPGGDLIGLPAGYSPAQVETEIRRLQRRGEGMTAKTIRMPVTTRCSRARCAEPATYWLIHEDGTENPGGYVCRAHGEAIVAEIREKTGELWSLAEITKL